MFFQDKVPKPLELVFGGFEEHRCLIGGLDLTFPTLDRLGFRYEGCASGEPFFHCSSADSPGDLVVWKGACGHQDPHKPALPISEIDPDFRPPSDAPSGSNETAVLDGRIRPYECGDDR
jgi:hypothetical protein